MKKIAIASGKGGTGKTTISTNLATRWSLTQNNIVLLDLDVEEPNSGLFLHGIKQKEEPQCRMVPHVDPELCTLCGRCQEVCQFNAIAMLPKFLEVYPELCHSCNACIGLCPEQALSAKKRQIGVVTHYRTSHFQFLESRLKIGEPSAVPLIRSTLKHIEDIQDGVLLMDAPPGTSCPVVEIFRNADLVILVTEPTPFGLHDLKLAVETAREMNCQFGVVINKSGIGDGTMERYLEDEKIPVWARVPYSIEIARIYSQGKLIADQLPEVAKEIDHLVENIQKQLK